MSHDKLEQAVALLQLLSSWRNGTRPVMCPTCGQPSLQIKDLSTRPHMEWYRFTCEGCGLNETVSRPLAMPGQSGIN